MTGRKLVNYYIYYFIRKGSYIYSLLSDGRERCAYRKVIPSIITLLSIVSLSVRPVKYEERDYILYNELPYF